MALPLEAELPCGLTIDLRLYRFPVGEADFGNAVVTPLLTRRTDEIGARTLLTVLTIDAGVGHLLRTAIIVAGDHVQAIALRLASRTDVIHAVAVQAVSLGLAIV